MGSQKKSRSLQTSNPDSGSTGTDGVTAVTGSTGVTAVTGTQPLPLAPDEVNFKGNFEFAVVGNADGASSLAPLHVAGFRKSTRQILEDTMAKNMKVVINQ